MGYKLATTSEIHRGNKKVYLSDLYTSPIGQCTQFYR